MSRGIYRDLCRGHRCRSQSGFLEQCHRSQNAWAHAIQNCDLPYQAHTTPANGQHIQGRRRRCGNYCNTLERRTPTKHVGRFLQFFAWSRTQQRKYCIRRIRGSESWQDPSVLRQRFQPAPRCMLDPIDFTAGELSAEMINSAQCPQIAELPADAEANKGECDDRTRKT